MHKCKCVCICVYLVCHLDFFLSFLFLNTHISILSQSTTLKSRMIRLLQTDFLIVCVAFRMCEFHSIACSIAHWTTVVCVSLFCRAVLYLIGWSELTPLTLRWPYLFSYWNQQCEESTRATNKEGEKTYYEVSTRNRTKRELWIPTTQTHFRKWETDRERRDEKTIGLVWTLWTLTLNSRHLENT